MGDPGTGPSIVPEDHVGADVGTRWLGAAPRSGDPARDLLEARESAWILQETATRELLEARERAWVLEQTVRGLEADKTALTQENQALRKAAAALSRAAVDAVESDIPRWESPARRLSRIDESAEEEVALGSPRHLTLEKAVSTEAALAHLSLDSRRYHNEAAALSPKMELDRLRGLLAAAEADAKASSALLAEAESKASSLFSLAESESRAADAARKHSRVEVGRAIARADADAQRAEVAEAARTRACAEALRVKETAMSERMEAAAQKLAARGLMLGLEARASELAAEVVRLQSAAEAASAERHAAALENAPSAHAVEARARYLEAEVSRLRNECSSLATLAQWTQDADGRLAGATEALEAARERTEMLLAANSALTSEVVQLRTAGTALQAEVSELRAAKVAAACGEEQQKRHEAGTKAWQETSVADIARAEVAVIALVEKRVAALDATIGSLVDACHFWARAVNASTVLRSQPPPSALEVAVCGWEARDLREALAEVRRERDAQAQRAVVQARAVGALQSEVSALPAQLPPTNDSPREAARSLPAAAAAGARTTGLLQGPRAATSREVEVEAREATPLGASGHAERRRRRHSPGHAHVVLLEYAGEAGVGSTPIPDKLRTEVAASRPAMDGRMGHGPGLLCATHTSPKQVATLPRNGCRAVTSDSERFPPAVRHLTFSESAPIAHGNVQVVGSLNAKGSFSAPRRRRSEFLRTTASRAGGHDDVSGRWRDAPETLQVTCQAPAS